MTRVANTPRVGPLASSGVAIAWRPDKVVRTGKMHEISFKGCCQFDCLAYKGAISRAVSNNGGCTFSRRGYAHASMGDSNGMFWYSRRPE